MCHRALIANVLLPQLIAPLAGNEASFLYDTNAVPTKIVVVGAPPDAHLFTSSPFLISTLANVRRHRACVSLRVCRSSIAFSGAPSPGAILPSSISKKSLITSAEHHPPLPPPPPPTPLPL